MDWKNRSAYVFIKTFKGKATDVWKRFQTWDNVIGTWIVSGDYDVIVWFDAQDMETVHRCVAEIKKWNEVEQTNSHMVYNGFKTEKWWWESPAGSWVLIREHMLQDPQKLQKWNWITSGASIPGEYDYISWVTGNSWDDVWNHLMELKTENWETVPTVPIKSWWNERWKDYGWWG